MHSPDQSEISSEEMNHPSPHPGNTNTVPVTDYIRIFVSIILFLVAIYIHMIAREDLNYQGEKWGMLFAAFFAFLILLIQLVLAQKTIVFILSSPLHLAIRILTAITFLGGILINCYTLRLSL